MFNINKYSMLSNRIKTVVLDPVFHNNNRTDFEIGQNMVLLSNLRLIDISILTSAASNIPVDTGVLGLIKNVFLYDGGVLLDQMYNFSDYIKFINANKSNDKNASINSILNGSLFGFSVTKGKQIDKTDSNIISLKAVSQYNTTYSTTFKGLFELNLVMDFLNNINYISTNIFKNLRLVIEWNNVSTITTFKSLVRPSLVYDQIIDEQMIMKIEKEFINMTISYKPIEREITSLAAIAANNTKQDITLQLKAFDDKTLIRILVLKTVSILQNKSFPFLAESLNLIVNGRQLIPYYGIDGPNKKAMYLNESWGSVNLLPGDNDISYLRASEITRNAALGQLNDYFGVNVGEQIKELIVNYSRTSDASGTSKLAINLLFYGEVMKEIKINEKGDYKIMYL
jgi:hypothetical protein